MPPQNDAPNHTIAAHENWFLKWPDGLIAVDHSGTIVAVSPKAEAILQWSESELKGRNLHQTLCAQNRGQQHDIDQCRLLAKDSLSNELASTVWQCRDGHYLSVDFRHIDIQYQNANVLLSFISNSERLHNQEEMQKFAEYVESSPAPIAELDSDGQLLFGNSAFQALLLEHGFNDLGLANVIPTNIEELCHTALSPERPLDADEHVIAEVKHLDHFFSWYFHPLMSNGESVEESDKESTVLAYAFDVTEQRQAEHLAEQQKSQARKEFYAMMVHELRTPLNAIIGFSNILLSRAKGKLSEKELDRLQSIQTAGYQLNELVTATLDITKIESGKMTLDISEFGVAESCREIHNQMQTLAEQKQLSYTTRFESEQAICSDKTKVRQVLINLISNAIKYTPDGEVSLVVEEKTHKELGNCIAVAVSDTGVGIPEDKISSVFVSFEQVADAKTRGMQGTGIGLSLVNDMMCLLGGVINVTSVYGEGSTFEVLLPYSATFSHN